MREELAEKKKAAGISTQPSAAQGGSSSSSGEEEDNGDDKDAKVRNIIGTTRMLRKRIDTEECRLEEAERELCRKSLVVWPLPEHKAAEDSDPRAIPTQKPVETTFWEITWGFVPFKFRPKENLLRRN